MKRWVGVAFLAIGALHTAVGVLFFGDVLPPVLREGVFNTVGRGQPDVRNAAFWFFFCGFLLLILGGVIDHVERTGFGMPAFLPWGLLAFAVAGGVMMPLSGFWLLLVPVAGMLLRRPSAVAPGR